MITFNLGLKLMNDVDVTNKLTANKEKFLIFDNHKKIEI
jgi:hypothetical protein